MEMRRLLFVILVSLRQLDRSFCADAVVPNALNYHWRTPPTLSRPPSSHRFGSDCTGVFCSDPLTLTPFGSPCGCVLPIKVELELGVAPYGVFTLVAELAVEIAAGTYVKQSQVRIMSAVSCDHDQERTRVVIHLVPLGEKFDNMTASLLYERFWQKKIYINATVFGDYKVIAVKYPGLPDTIPSSPRESGAHELPFAARLPTEETHKTISKTVAAIIISFFIFIVSCAVIACIVVKKRRLKHISAAMDSTITSSMNKQSGMKFVMPSNMTSSTSLPISSMSSTCPFTIKTFTLAQLELATNKFNSHNILGEGGFGYVYHGIIDDGSEVAVKLLKRQDQNGDREFIAEIEMLSRLHHRNLVKLLGICIEGCTRCLVYELVRNGSVESHLHGVDRKKGLLDWDTRIKIALGSARALAYLHEDSNPHVIHRDFKASNILLDDDFTPKISDFGLAREAAEGSHHVSTHVMGTFGYVAPEYAMTGHLLVKSDVYSYGVVLLELLSGRRPVDMSQPAGQENLVTWARPLLTCREGLEQLADRSLDGKYNFDCFAKVVAIASMCVQPEVSHRPFMGEVIQALKLVYDDTDETCEDFNSNKDCGTSGCNDCKGETGMEVSWWDGGTPRMAVGGYASSYMTMECSSIPFDERPRLPSSPFMAARVNSLVMPNRSGPLRTKRNRYDFARLRGSMSDHGYLPRFFASGGSWF